MNILFENAKIQDYKGYEQSSFFYNGHLAHVILPKTPNPDGRWIWRAEFLGAFDTVDMAMLEKGWTLVNYSISDMYGTPAAVELMKRFMDFLTSELSLYPKTILFGFSRGGLYSLNFAARYPSLVSALYLDAPVLDIASWPGGLGKGAGSPNEYKDCLAQYGLDEETVRRYGEENPEKFGILTASGIPLALVVGDSDEAVPHEENCQLLADFYIRHGAKLLYILKKGCGHHPHSMDDPSPVVEFLLENRL
ncbi:MAG: alpha/beta fold hydrolase [Eubacteriales bacterium]